MFRQAVFSKQGTVTVISGIPNSHPGLNTINQRRDAGRLKVKSLKKLYDPSLQPSEAPNPGKLQIQYRSETDSYGF